MTNRYHNIGRIEDLDAAIRANSLRISGKKDEVLNSYEEAKEFYSPASLFASGLRSISDVIPFDRIVLDLVRRLKDRILRKV